MPQETYTLTLSMHSLQTIAAVSAILFLTLITRAVLGVVGEKRPNLWPEVMHKTWAKWTVSIIGPLFFFALCAAFAVVYDTIHNVFFPPTSGASSPNLGAGALIAALLGAPFVIWGTYIKYQSLGFQREGHITDRISKAVEQLGAEKTLKRVDAAGLSMEETVPNIEVRIGGLLSIERIAQDSVKYDKGRDHVRMMEILCAYIRNNAPASGAVAMPELPSWEYDRTVQQTQQRFEYLKNWKTQLTKPREDIQLALNIIGRRDAVQRGYEARWGGDANIDRQWVFDIPCPKLTEDSDPKHAATPKSSQAKMSAWEAQINSYTGYRLDLRDTNLQCADLSHLVLSGAQLDNSLLQGADLKHTRLQGAHLRLAQMQGAELWDAQLQGADLLDAQLQSAILIGAKLQGAYLIRTQLQGALLERAQLQRTNLIDAQLQRADLRRSQLRGALLDGAQLQRASFFGARLQGASLKYAQLQGVLWEGAILQQVALRATKMDPAFGLTKSQLASTFGDGSVRLPEAPPRPAHWPEAALDDNSFASELTKWRASPDTYLPPS